MPVGSIRELIPYQRFAQLRLAQFDLSADDRAAVCALTDWRYLGGIWIGEGIGPFTDFLRLETMPDDLGAMTLDLQALQPELSSAILARIGLPLRRGMFLSEAEGLLGAPNSETQFVPDRRTYTFAIGEKWPYLVKCTIHENDGLAYVVIVRSDVHAELSVGSD
jgi:hypothetical protein